MTPNEWHALPVAEREQKLVEAYQLIEWEERRIRGLMYKAGLAEEGDYSAHVEPYYFYNGSVIVRLRAGSKVFMNADNNRCNSTTDYCLLGNVEKEIAEAKARLATKKGRK